ncbi:hypothetical protein ACFSQ7_18620 [Paenibacillus rhizoplanae]
MTALNWRRYCLLVRPYIRGFCWASITGISRRSKPHSPLRRSWQLCYPAGLPVISESGITGPEDIAYLRKTRATGVLVGEYLMRQPDVEQAVHQLLGPLSAGKDRVRHD